MIHIRNTINKSSSVFPRREETPILDVSDLVAVKTLIDLLLSTPVTFVDASDAQALVAWPAGSKGMMTFVDEDMSTAVNIVHRFLAALTSAMQLPPSNPITIDRSMLRPPQVKRAFAESFGVLAEDELAALEQLDLKALTRVLDIRDAQRCPLQDALIAYINEPKDDEEPISSNRVA